jgi:hypothetical protein
VCIGNQGGGGPKTFGNRWCRPWHNKHTFLIRIRHFPLDVNTEGRIFGQEERSVLIKRQTSDRFTLTKQGFNRSTLNVLSQIWLVNYASETNSVFDQWQTSINLTLLYHSGHQPIKLCITGLRGPLMPVITQHWAVLPESQKRNKRTRRCRAWALITGSGHK